MDPRRFNDTLKLVGALVAGLAVFAPILGRTHANWQALVSEVLSALPGVLAAFAAGVGTRGKGLEYESVAEAKALAKVTASMMPPANDERPTSPEMPSKIP